MPVYEYIENGRRIERTLPVERRDDFPGRVSVPSRIRVLTHAYTQEGEYADAEVLKGFQREESKNPQLNDQIRAGLGLSPTQVKDIWRRPQPVYKPRPGELVT